MPNVSTCSEMAMSVSKPAPRDILYVRHVDMTLLRDRNGRKTTWLTPNLETKKVERMRGITVMQYDEGQDWTERDKTRQEPGCYT